VRTKSLRFRSYLLRRLFPLLAAGCLAAVAAAHQYELGALTIAHPWSRPTAPGMSMGVAYFFITNHGSAPDVLIGASTPAAASVQMHQTTITEGMARMRPLTEIVIAPGATVRIEPGGIHLMLVELKAPLELGKSVPLELQFRTAGKITVQLSIEARDAPPAT
jgi:copper(I)-binding protein